MYSSLFTGGVLASFLLGTASAAAVSTSIDSTSQPAPEPTQTDGQTQADPPSGPSVQTASASPTADIGLGFFSLARQPLVQGHRDIKTTYGCFLEFGGKDVLGCKPSSPVYIASDGLGDCTEQSGRYTTDMTKYGCDGAVTVEFSSTSTGPTYMHYAKSDGSYTGCTHPSGKGEGASCINNQMGTGSFGSPQYVGSWCVAKIVQYQKPKPTLPPTDPRAQYGFYVEIYDSATNGTGDNGRNLIAASPSGEMYNVQTGAVLSNPFGGKGGKTSLLPGVFSITPGKTDPDPYTISYQNPYTGGDLTAPSTETFDSYSTAFQCSLAAVVPKPGEGSWWGYADKTRTNRCGFHC